MEDRNEPGAEARGGVMFEPALFRPSKHGQRPAGEPRIHDLRQSQCKYPTGYDGGEHRFCAAPVARFGAPYCAAHDALCHGMQRERLR